MSNGINIKAILTLSFMGLAQTLSFGQTDINGDNSLQISLTGGGKVSFERTDKISENPSFVDTIKVDAEVDYTSINKKIPTRFEVQTIKPPKLRIVQPLDQLRKGEFRIGVNDFKTLPFLELNLSTLRKKEYNTGFSARHFSSELGVNDLNDARFSETSFDYYGKKFYKKSTLFGSVDYDYNTFRFYGYDQNNLTVPLEHNKQNYSLLNAEIGLKSRLNIDTKNNYSAALNYNQLYSYLGVEEHLVSLTGFVDGDFLPKLAALDSVDLSSYSGKWRVDAEASQLFGNKTSGSFLVNLRPSYRIKNNRLSAAVALPTFFQTENERFLKIRPAVDLEFSAVKDIMILYAKWDARYSRNSYQSYVNSNPFIDSAAYTNTFIPTELVGGLKGALTSKTTFNVGASYQVLRNKVIFINDFSSVGGRTFTVTTDNGYQRTIFGEILYENDKLKTGLIGELNAYDLENDLEYHLPQIYAQTYFRYSIKKKLDVGLDLFYYGKQFALGFADSMTDQNTAFDLEPSKVELDPIFDFNVSLDYHYSSRLGAFVKVNNILSTNHQRWNQYPNYGINVLGGIFYSF